MSKKTKEGDCYKANAEWMIENKPGDDWFICHGEAIGQGPIKGVKFGHCWLENKDLVLDFSNGRQIVIKKNQYYKIGKIKNVKRYKQEELMLNMFKTKKYGPWDESITTP